MYLTFTASIVDVFSHWLWDICPEFPPQTVKSSVIFCLFVYYTCVPTIGIGMLYYSLKICEMNEWVSRWMNISLMLLGSDWEAAYTWEAPPRTEGTGLHVTSPELAEAWEGKSGVGGAWSKGVSGCVREIGKEKSREIMGHKTRKTSQVLGRFKHQGEHLVLNLRGGGKPGEWARTALTSPPQGDLRKGGIPSLAAEEAAANTYCRSFGQTCKAHEAGTADKR